MNASTANRLDDLFAEFPILVSEEGASDSEIDVAEKAIGATFLPDYRWFLRRYGGAMVKSLPVLGLRYSEVMGVGRRRDDVVSEAGLATHRQARHYFHRRFAKPDRYRE
jgi:hypothetical protein